MNIDPITKYIIQEGYILSDKDISVNLLDFEQGKQKKLLIVGVMGSGKTTIGEKLSKDYNVKWISIDSLWWRLTQAHFKGVDMSVQANKDKLQDKFEEAVRGFLNSNERLIIEGINLIEKKYRPSVLKHPMIILGLSSLRAGIRGAIRNRKREDEGPMTYYWMVEKNMREVEPLLNDLRKQVVSLPGADIQVYK